MPKPIRTFSNDEGLVAQRRKEIVQSSTKLFVKKGYDRTSMSELAQALGMSKAGIYHYIGAKDDILYLIIQTTFSLQRDYLTKMRDRVSQLSATEALRESLKSLLEIVNEYQDMYIFNNHVMVNLRWEERNQMFNASLEMIDYFESLLLEGTETGEFVVPDPRLYANNIVTLVFQWATRRWFTQKQYTLSQYSKELTEYILKTTRPEGSKSDAMKVTGTLTTAPSNHVSGD